ncbi:MAG: ABC transporter ATP-binding protein [Hyphomicrobium sp.]|nr:ABC transporter ATP-binding protein [Hyphomicrobium sp.]
MTVSSAINGTAAGTAPADRRSRTAAPQSGFAPWKDPSRTPIIRFENVTKKFGDFVAVDNITLDIYEREFFALLGPSGCGKTTLLRMLAGFEKPTEGRVIVDGQDITDLAPYERSNINMMFQSYALFPHMTVERNVGFGLRQEGMPAEEIKQRVDEAMALVELGKFAHRKPHQLSGGQQQRVALARAIAKKPRIMLLDEPLGALDKKLRNQAQFELMRIQEQTGTTFVIVTHDQEEAMTVASRIAVMHQGKLEQVSTPGEIYEAPKSRYVAQFIGDVNIMEGKVVALPPDGTVDITPASGDGRIFKAVACDGLAIGQNVWLSVRPEKFRISLDEPQSGVNVVKGRVDDVGYLGSISHYHVHTEAGNRVTALRANSSHSVERAISWDDTVWLEWPVDASVLLKT